MSVKVRTSSSSHKVRDHNSTSQQICLCVYLYTDAMEADLALWWKTRVARRSAMSKWQSFRERSICKWSFTQLSCYSQRTCIHTKAELLTFIDSSTCTLRARPNIKPSIRGKCGTQRKTNKRRRRHPRGKVTLHVCLCVCVRGVQMGGSEKM